MLVDVPSSKVQGDQTGGVPQKCTRTGPKEFAQTLPSAAPCISVEKAQEVFA